ncbi:Amastin surface glycoprotein [Trypanosoma melophagium]|uniref:Amastin surface glycoprotein n=1 Tax=Trypanosoma melophagium TaxID=715481 RepID=UPI00351A47A3|nr:Amastin surface glycoprotein [Trypanosoma melophagium]
MLKGFNKMFEKKNSTNASGVQQGNEAPHARRQQQQQQYSPRADDDDYNESLSEISENEGNRGAGREQRGESTRPVTTTTTNSNRNNTSACGAVKKDKTKAKKEKKNPVAPVMGKVHGFFSAFNSKFVFSMFFIVSFVNWFFMILATALSQLDVVGGACYTYWGYKAACDTVSYTIRTELIACSKIKQRLQAGAAFSILAVLLMSTLLFFNLKALMIYRVESRKRKYAVNGTSNGEEVNQQEQKQQLSSMVVSPLKWYIVGVSGAALICELICWCMTVSIYASRYCEDPLLPRSTAYGVGFGLLLTAWIVKIIALPIFAFAV